MNQSDSVPRSPRNHIIEEFKLQESYCATETGVSVIIPAYNYAHYLPSAIDSVLAQSYSPVEIIVIDDGSTDNTAEVVSKYGERVRYIYQKNSGLSAARNTGIFLARYPFVAFLDADDVWMPDMLERVMKVFTELPEDYGIVAAHPIYIDSEGRKLPSSKSMLFLEGEIKTEDILLMTRFPPSSVVARRIVFDECGMFDTGLRSSEDRDMWLRASAKWRIYLIGQPLVLIRKHTSNMSSNADRMKVNMAKVIKKAFKQRLYPRWKIWGWLQALAIHRYQTGLIYLGLKKRVPAFFDLLLSVMFWPVPISGRKIASRMPCIRLRALLRTIF